MEILKMLLTKLFPYPIIRRLRSKRRGSPTANTDY